MFGFLTPSLLSTFGADLYSCNLPYYVCYFMTPSPSDADIISGSSLISGTAVVFHKGENGKVKVAIPSGRDERLERRMAPPERAKSSGPSYFFGSAATFGPPRERLRGR